MNWLTGGWTGFYALSNAWLLLLLIPLLILYFLKLKRPRMEISSLALWQQVINDQRVNSPFQKFKRNLLLLLQLLLLMALILAAMQPFFRSGGERAQYIPVLLDCSASMAAVDESGASRLDVAKQRIGKLIDDLLPDQQLSFISVGANARLLTSFTDNKRVLRDALASAQVADVSSELEDALRLTQALSRTNRFDKIIVYSDGNLPEAFDFELPYEVNYQRVPAAGANIGITAMNARRANADEWNVFVRVQASEHVTAANVEVLQDDKPVAEDYVKLESGAAQRLVFRLPGVGKSNVTVRLKPDGEDSLASDNTAGLQLPQGRSLAVYCDPKLSSFRKALGVLKQIEIYPATEDGAVGRSQFDLLISDSPPKEGIDANVQLLAGFVPKDLEKTVTINTGGAEVVDWQRNANLLQHVELNAVIFSDEPSSFPNISDADYEALGYEILAFSRNAPLILKKRTEGDLRYQLLFNPDRSTMPYRVGFPIMVANAVGIALQEAALSEVRGIKTGVLPPLRVGSPSTSYSVTGPEGTKAEATSNEQEMVSGIAAPLVGKYSLKGGSDQILVQAALLNGRETSLKAVDELQFKELSVDAAETEVKSDRPIWPWLAMGGFALLLTEWWYSNRRPVAM